MSKQRKRNNSGSVIYGIFITIWTLILAGAAFFVLKHYVWTYAEEYEATQITPVIEEYMDGLRENLLSAGVVDTIKSMPHEFQTDEECEAVVLDMLQGELHYLRGSSQDPAVAAYDLLCGENIFGRVFLVQDESKKDELMFPDMLPWKVLRDEFYFTGFYTGLSVTVPSDYSVMVNGRILDESFITETGIHYDVLEKFYEEYPNLPTKVTYHVDQIFGHIQPVILDRHGAETVIDPAQDDSQFIEPLDEGTVSRMNTFAWDFTRNYLAFNASVQDMTYLYQLLRPYIVIDSDLDVRLHQAIDGQYGYSHTTAFAFGEARLNNVTALGNGYYIVDVTATATTLQPAGTQYVERNLLITCVDSGGDIRALSAEDY